MLHIDIDTVWRFRKEGSPQTIVVMLRVLNEIRKTGKITSAAIDAQLSYRHVWNLIEQWSAFFGAPLVETQRGKGSKLTPDSRMRFCDFLQRTKGPLIIPTTADLSAHVRARLAGYKAPRTWIFVDAFPLTGSGKVKKFELREQYLKGELTPSE